MKSLLMILLCGLSMSAAGQTKIEKIIPAKAGQAVSFHFDYPELVRVTTWDKKEISIQGSVSINGGENDEAFVLNVDNGSTLRIEGKIKNMDDLPQRITVMRDGVKTVFRNEGEFQKFKKEFGKGNFDMVNKGLDLEITLEIKVPVNTQTHVTSVYGMVEVISFRGPLSVDATYGGVDVSLTESTTGELVAETNYGHIYSDLSIKFNGANAREEDFHLAVSAKPGVGPAYRFESPYGNVYLRKAKN